MDGRNAPSIYFTSDQIMTERLPAPEMPEHLQPLFDRFQQMYDELSDDQKFLCQLLQAESAALALGSLNDREVDVMVRNVQISVLEEAYRTGMR